MLPRGQEKSLGLPEAAPGPAELAQLVEGHPEIVENHLAGRERAVRTRQLERHGELVASPAEAHAPELQVSETRAQNHFHPTSKLRTHRGSLEAIESSSASLLGCLVARVEGVDLRQLRVDEDQILDITVRVRRTLHLLEHLERLVGHSGPVVVDSEAAPHANLLCGRNAREFVAAERLQDTNPRTMVSGLFQGGADVLHQPESFGRHTLAGRRLLEKTHRAIEGAQSAQKSRCLQGDRAAIVDTASRQKVARDVFEITCPVRAAVFQQAGHAQVDTAHLVLGPAGADLLGRGTEAEVIATGVPPADRIERLRPIETPETDGALALRHIERRGDLSTTRGPPDDPQDIDDSPVRRWIARPLPVLDGARRQVEAGQFRRRWNDSFTPPRLEDGVGQPTHEERHSSRASEALTNQGLRYLHGP